MWFPDSGKCSWKTGANRVMSWTRTLAKTGTTLAAFALASDTYANATKGVL